MINILHLTKSELILKLESLGEKKFRAKQIWQWLYQKDVSDFAQMTNLSKEIRQKLQQHFSITLPTVSTDLLSKDKTRKWLLKFDDCREIETVFIPEEKRGTLCISSQVGCTLACKFCHTGTQTWVRNLEFHEIVAQVMMARKLLDQKVTNIVYMGMGEPFFNYDNVKKSVEILTDEDGLAFSNKKITISTSGLVPEILKCSKELKTGLAISLHGANDDLRTDIMAINKKYPLDALLQSCKIYNQENPGQKITFEYVMLEGVNDSKTHANELVKLIKKHNVNAKINLIPFNGWEGCEYSNTQHNQILNFQKILKNSGLIAPIRKTRGEDAMAACGQLKSLSKRVGGWKKKII
ncbi:MAG: 23S rRNA (adenine(2503)-C(2))-methyltransferase RlmN [Rickettsiales bacterium]|nr:23S rRNA (adenine(2503)-C(2))-methyltransferase RlmN [Rickettsiales bacterium]